MKTTQKKTSVSILSSVLLVLVVTVTLDCGDITITGPGHGRLASCAVGWDSLYPRGGTYSRQKPTSCPFKTNQLGLSVSFAATGVVPYGSTNRWAVTTIYNWNRYQTGAYINQFWSTQYNSGTNQYDDTFTMSGTYDAATAGWHAADNTGYDSSVTSVQLPDGRYAQAFGILDYIYGTPSIDIAGPGTIYGGASYTATGLVYDAEWVDPVTWQWSVDGMSMSETSAEFTWNAGPAGTTQEIDVTATDGNGLIHSASTFVTGCGQEFIC
jgi:hypothetical protein